MLDVETAVICVRPQTRSDVVVHIVAGNGGPVDVPELSTAGATAASLPGFPVVSVVAGNFIVIYF